MALHRSPRMLTRREAARDLLLLPGAIGCCASLIAEAAVDAVSVQAAPSSSGNAQPLAGAPPDAWPQFRGSALLTGVSRSPVPPALTVRWSHETGDVIESSPTIRAGIVYVSVGNGTLIALDLATGTVRWKHTIDNQELIGESSPAITPEAAYFGDLAGTVHAVNVRDGSRLWTFKTEGEIRASPVVSTGLVIVGSYDTNLYGIDALTGRLKWKRRTDGQVHSTAAVRDGLAFVAGCDTKLRAIRIADGTEAYQIPSGAYTAASPALDATHAYFGTYNEEVLALDLRTRRTKWRFHDPAKRFPFYSSAGLSGGRLYVGGRDKSVHAISIATGKPVWTFLTKARVDSSPAIAAGRVFVGSSDGRLYVLDAATGAKRWDFDAGGAITGSPAIASERVVIGAQNGVVYCFG